MQIRLIGSLLLCGVLTACGVMSDDDSDKKNNDIVRQDGKGCVQGVVLDGITNERIALKNANSDEGVQVLVRNKLLHAKTMVDGTRENVNEKLKGEYHLCGIPLDTAFPIFAWKDGFQEFEGLIMIPSTVKHRSEQAEVGDIKLDYPTIVADIHLYQEGAEAQDLRITVYHGDTKVDGARVQLIATGKNVLHSDRSTRLAPQIRASALLASTNKNGLVKFNGADLVLGGIYDYKILPPAGGEDLAFTKGTVQIGLRQSAAEPGTASEPYDLHVSISSSTPKLKKIASTLDVRDYDGEAKIVYWFNQDVELAPSAADTYYATLSNATRAQLRGGANSTDSMEVIITGNRVELIPNWKANLKPKFEKEENIAVNYSGIVLRPVGDSRAAVKLPLGAVSVKVFDQ